MTRLFITFFAAFLIVGVYYVPVEAQATIPNPGFETWENANTPAGWTYNTAVTRSDIAHSGSYSARLSGVTPWSSSVQQDFSTRLTAPFSVSSYAYASDSAQIAISIVDEDGDGPPPCIMTVSAGWQYTNCNFTWPAPIANLVIAKYGGSDLLIDDVLLTFPPSNTPVATPVATPLPLPAGNIPAAMSQVMSTATMLSASSVGLFIFGLVGLVLVFELLRIFVVRRQR